MKSTQLLILFWLLLASEAQGQREAYNWYFGHYAGITFKTSPPTPLTDGALKTDEGCASISDSLGNLLFYTDGITIYNRFHQPMPNGHGLKGDPSSTQSGVILKQPGKDSIYYVFSVDRDGIYHNDGLTYSIVDMSLDGGKGDVMKYKKNQWVISPTVEKLAAIKHGNGKDIWLITHSRNNDMFHVLLFTEKGLESVARPRIGARHVYHRGYMKFSPSGNKLAVVHDIIELFDFDVNTGQLTEWKQIDHKRAYGIEFSPDETYLYSGYRFLGDLYQHDLIEDSTQVVARNVRLGCMQNGPDGRLYIAQFDTEYLGVIKRPNESALNCGFQPNAIHLGRTCREGLPNVLGYPILPSEFFVSDTCYGDSTQFHQAYENRHAYYQWEFGDPTGDTNQVSIPNPKYRFSAPGDYTVTLRIRLNGESKKIVRKVTIMPLPERMLDSVVSTCPGDTVYLDAKNPGSQYKWRHGPVTKIVPAVRQGYYRVRIKKNECAIEDSVRLEVRDSAKLNLGPDSTSCPTHHIELLSSNGDSTVWFNGEKAESMTIAESGTYWATLYQNTCTASDTVEINFHPTPKAHHFDTALCVLEGERIVLSDVRGTHHYWKETRDSTNRLEVGEEGNYTLRFLDSNGCRDSSTFTVGYSCGFTFYVPNAFTPNGDPHNPVFKPVYRNVEKVHMTIFNRWGEQIFDKDIGPDEGWDGRFRGVPCPEGVYVCILSYEEPFHRGTRRRWHHSNVTLLK